MNKVIKNTILVFIGIICLYESGLGIWQIVGSRLNIISNGFCTGSFENPGPYGGFLAVCFCILGAYSVDKQEAGPIRLLTSISAITAIIVIPSTQSRAAMLSLLCAATTAAVLNPQSRYYLKKYWIVLSVSVVVLTAIAYNLKRPSADGRLFIDKICINAMCENGWKGVGLGHFGGAYGKAQASCFKKQIKEKGKDDLDWRAINEHDRMTADCPDNAFNEYLFIGVEAGPLAMLLFIGIMVSAIVVSFKRGTIWCYGLTAFAVFAMFSYPLHVKQFQLMLPVLLAAAISDGEPKTTRTKVPEMAILSMTLVILSIIAIRKWPQVRLHKQAEATWKKAERWHKMEYYEYVVEDCDTLLPYMKHDYRFLFAYGQSLNKTGNYEKSDSILRMGTEISSDPMFWNVMGNNSLAQGKYREAEERYKHAFFMVPNRLYPLYLLAKLYHTEGDTVRFLDMADRVVETFIPKVESANTEQLRAEIRELKAGYKLESEQIAE